nr:MAG TPA: hypothetical protein [Caudoviricetes sp.]
MGARLGVLAVSPGRASSISAIPLDRRRKGQP